MPRLNDAELRVIAEIVEELAKIRGTSLDKAAKGFAFARAARIDPKFRAKLAEVHRRLEARRKTNMPRQLLVPIGPLFCDLERRADSVLRGWREME